ncbi:MAG: bifunctional folylpolyglutamate synthase/dihydrofolate synthase [Breznakia sp.]
MKFTHSQEVIERIENKRRNGIELRQFKAFMKAIGNPQNSLQSIHVAGTNGKGSTVNNLRSIFEEAGYNVGCFTSPYLETHHDRIRINNVNIPDARIVKYANAYYDRWLCYDLSMFEIDMFIATMYFVEEKVDYAIFEVGLGGTLDATNILDPLVSVISNIGKDHMEYLGDTYTSIAQAKAGIIKEGKVLITAEKRDVCLQVFHAQCARKHTRMICTQEVKDMCVDEELSFTYRGVLYKQDTKAKYQALNASLAIETILYLRAQQGIEISHHQIQEGIYNAHWKGRFEVLRKQPLLLIDGAHNVEGVCALIDSLQDYDNINILFSALKDKPYSEMLTILERVSSRIYVCEFPFYRSQKASIIAQGHDVTCIEDYEAALAYLLAKEEPLLICGSLYFISLVRNKLMKGESTLSIE